MKINHLPIKLLLLCALTQGTIVANAQFRIHGATNFKGSGALTTNVAITNQSANTKLDDVSLTLLGESQSLTTNSNLTLSTLTINDGGTKTLTGNWTVTDELNLVEGKIQAPTANGESLTYTGAAQLQGSSSSYVIGFLHLTKGGEVFFPIGTQTSYAPASIESAQGTIAMRVVEGDANPTIQLNDVSYFPDHYWEVSAVPSSIVSLSLSGAESFLEQGSPVVLQASSTGSVATSLDGSFSTDFVTSLSAATQAFLIIGKAPEFTLTIHDMITPYDATSSLGSYNDKLTIENIEKVSENTVKLVDRWGLVVKEWKNYSNDIEYDFATFSPGNYVCIVEYKYPGESKSTVSKGMVTILKSK